MNMGIEKDVLYIDRVLAGDTKSYSYLVEKYKDKTYSLILGIVKNSEDAEEVAQDAFVKAFNALESFKKESSFSTWLYRIAYNSALTKIRSQKPIHDSIDENVSNLNNDVVNSAFAELVKDDRKKYLKAALDRLTSEERLIVDLYYSEEKDLSEIAQIIGITHGSIRVKLLRVRNKLKDILNNILNTDAREVL